MVVRHAHFAILCNSAQCSDAPLSLPVNTVWAPGGMGQFDTLTIAERKSLVEAWSAACKAEGLYFIAHVGTTVVGEAIASAPTSSAHARTPTKPSSS